MKHTLLDAADRGGRAKSGWLTAEGEDSMNPLPEFDYLLFERVEEAICRITLNRPDRLNSYTPRLCAELSAALAHYQRADEFRVVILTGQGRAFCVGGDVKGDDPDFAAMHSRQLGRGRDLSDTIHAALRQLSAIDKPVLAQVNGLAVAGGLALALMSDYRVAGASARIGDTSGRVGLLPDDGGSWAFPRAMGLDHALMMVWRNQLFTAAEALGKGLVSEVVPDDELTDYVLELARDLAKRAPISVRVAKTLLRQSLAGTLDSALVEAALAVEFVNTSGDAKEGMAAFREKRLPVFRGR